MYSTTHQPARYDSWFASEDDNGTYYITDLDDDSYHTTHFVSNDPSNRSDIIYTSSGHSQTPSIDFQVLLDTDKPSCISSLASLNYLSRQSSTDSQTSNSSSVSATISDSDIDIKAQLKLNTPKSLYLLFKANRLPVLDQFGDRWRLLCPECGSWCQTSVHTALPLCTPGQFKSLTNHRGSKKCAATASKKQKHNTQKAGTMIKPSFQSDQPSNAYDRNIMCSDISSLKRDIVCPGIPINWPDDLHTFAMSFPWARYHDRPDGLPFTVDITVPRLPHARSKLCTHLTIREDFPCEECETVLSEDGVEGVGPGESQGENDDEEVMLTFEEALIDDSDSPADAPPAQSNQPRTQDSSSPPLPQGPGIRPDDYLLYNGRWIHKQTVCRLIINKDFISKSLNRLEHVRAGYTKVNKCIDMSAGRITNQNLFLVGDIFVTILRSSRTLSIAVLRSTAASLCGISHSSINIGVMKASRTTAKITGQLLTIIATHLSADVSQMFLWDGGYVTACSVIQGSSESTERSVVVTIPGSLVEPVNPEPTFIRLRDDINVDDFLQVRGGQSTWQISRDALQAACDLLWAKAVEINVPLKSIAVVTPSDETKFPYRRLDGTPAVISMEASNLLGASEGDRISVCPLCESSVLNMRNHMGQHILHALSNTPEEVVLKEPVGDTLPCGFCGRSDRPECAITVTVPAKAATTWDTKCMYQHQFRYASAETGSKNTPCRNLPLKCELCHPILPPAPGKTTRKTAVVPVGAVWRYNMHKHIFREHEEYMVPGQRDVGLPLPANVWREMKLTDLEQTASHIPKTHWQPSYTPPGEIGKENIPPLVSHGSKRAAPQAGSSRPSKKKGPIFQPAARRGAAQWLFDERNVQPRTLVDSRKQKKQKVQIQKGQGQEAGRARTQPRAQMSMSAALTDTELEVSDSSFTSPETDKSFGAKGYDDKNPNKKRLRASATTEGKWTLLFNVVQAAMYAIYKDTFPKPSAAFPFRAMDVISSPPKRIWSSQLCNTPVPDDTTTQKPDIILVDCNLRNLSLRWCNIITCVEHTDSELDISIPLYCGSGTKGQLRLHYFDRSGLISSCPVNIYDYPVHLLEVLNTLTLAHTNNLGYDPTMHMCDPTCKGSHTNLREHAIGWVESYDQAILSIMSVLWRSQGFFSRGTICYHVQTSDGTEYALKDCWVAEKKKYHEVTVLKMVEGIQNVVKLVADWDVLYDGESDCTYRIRASHGVCSSRFIRRFHRRLLLTPCGEPLVLYSSKLELLKAFHDFVTAHALMLGKHVLHGDLSPNNFILHDGRGYFIDFDHARILAEGTDSIPSEGTGTRPYMSIRLLREGIAKNNAMIQHTASDDLESLFHIFVEFATTFDGPRGLMRDENRRPLWVHKFESADDDPWVAKQAYVLAPRKDTSLMDKTTPFFAPFSQITQDWRHLILAAASDSSDPSDHPVGVTHAVLTALLEKWTSQLPPDAPTEIMVPVASSSRLGHPPPDDAQSSARLCRSTRIQQQL
ncbi:hypothetical protein DEU56DRAFT_963173 [Suillus clintonianus]|uniref:uncharacterized protein n=1 Tax=Suillus clintonianus TaxID=1904413 RepID=UPI001B87F28F|nr:uncharacterized protein DEU56DRAFT_963173 [Suillus clintonianus]KAG2124873.1 hypothetical protein DEU56DRAFT_963173 [Suillus clintonianus]